MRRGKNNLKIDEYDDQSLRKNQMTAKLKYRFEDFRNRNELNELVLLLEGRMNAEDCDSERRKNARNLKFERRIKLVI